ncbi:hypothetical protein ANAEL_03155 [Anaerolineales bacterium]|nr:hypothetical protein ANAEL_03155 [Anaerolineales bacterium]
MEKISALIPILLEHSQRFSDFWNFHIIVSLGVLGFVLANEGIASKLRVRLLLTVTFFLIAVYSVFSLSIHQQRQVKLWDALEARIATSPVEFIPEEVDYIDSLKPTDFGIKIGALLTADLLVVLAVWFIPKMKD